ncbi:ubiquitin-related modifier 1-like protein [Moniliophthora roreri MCA 2997]|uniref:Ubiquitin-related modifier 1 n=1 Tax=Moniliophthora roreri (strain MCA 2997) TaxID=1381753 RepID=V2XID8_MONRO|nr:ubiquitin-related modifier 1-like protein [Moniliophthora roreri MCA 2997]
MSSSISVRVEFGGGLELLFSNEKRHSVTIPVQVPTNNDTKLEITRLNGDTKPVDVDYLIHYLRDHLLKERAELFMGNDTVRPGILVLINDTDWELEGEGAYALKNNDEIVFISTLHGG